MNKLLLLPLLLFLSACGTSVNVDYQPGTDFTALRTFRVDDKPVALPNDPRVNSPFTLKRISEALNNQLSQKGMAASQTSPDIIVKYHLGIKLELESDNSGITFGIGSSSSHTGIGIVYTVPSAEVASNENLTLTIDMIKAGTEKLLWRGSFTSRLVAGSTPESSTRQINTMVGQILDKFPPK